MKLKGIIFDGDGVLFDTEKLHVMAWKKVLSSYGISLNFKDFEEGIGVEDSEFLKKMKRKGKISKNLNIEKLVEEKSKELLNILDVENVKISIKIKNVLKILKRKYKIAIASNSERKFVLKVLEKLKISEYFDTIITRDDVKNPKPSPEIYLLISKKLKIPPSNLIAFEDSNTGISAAKKGGIFCVGVATTQPVEKIKNADIIINELNLKNVKKVIKNFEGKNEN